APSYTVTPTLRRPTKTPTLTTTPTPTVTSTPSITPTPKPGVGSTWISPKDGMVMMFVPAGEFSMGSNTGESDERPIHTVYLDSYWIDKTEVTNAMYKKCVDAGKCNPPNSSKSYTRDSYYGNSEFNDFPVIYVSWNDAKAYCDWRGDGTRLPTEAEWEKAASWDDDKKEKRVYPWGDSISCSFANYWGKDGGCIGDTTKVGSYPSGASFYGALDMAGNVWEWVADWYNAAYYGSSPSSNPLGPTSGQYRVLRGGSWLNGNNYVRSSYRNWFTPDDPYIVFGFRCARSLP
ncbi:MAG: formylglycine-generating enzyme family protein, partial [Anaerolineales bacterium]|nr:formylglycine-generating enzyme family protein [Anaerolineales bacterium]